MQLYYKIRQLMIDTHNCVRPQFLLASLPKFLPTNHRAANKRVAYKYLSSHFFLLLSMSLDSFFLKQVSPRPLVPRAEPPLNFLTSDTVEN